jgi:hypothetical protein
MVHLLLRLLLDETMTLADLLFISLMIILFGVLLFTKTVEGSPFENLNNVSNVPLSCPSVPIFFLLRI